MITGSDFRRDEKTKPAKFHSGVLPIIKPSWLDYLRYEYGGDEAYKMHSLYQCLCSLATFQERNGKRCRVKIEEGELFYTSLRSIGNISGMSPNTVKRYLEMLSKVGLIKAEIKPGKGVTILFTFPIPRPPKNHSKKRKVSARKQSVINDLLVILAELHIEEDMLQAYIVEQIGRKSKLQNLSIQNLQKIINRIKNERSPMIEHLTVQHMTEHEVFNL